jgi:hypothetical protein
VTFQQNEYPLVVPKLDGGDERELCSFRDRWFNFDSMYRSRKCQTAAENINYILGNQWIELDRAVLLDSSRGYVFRDIPGRQGVELPRPMSNYTGSAAEVELAALLRRKLVPSIITTSRDPRDQAAAKQARELLDYRNYVNNWPSKRHLFTFLAIVTGTAIMRSFWDERWTDLTEIASPSAMQCPACNKVISSPLVESRLVEGLPGAVPVEADHLEQGMYSNLTACPACGEPSLAPYVMSREDAQGVDTFGRPLKMQVPKGNTAVEVDDIFETYPENSGVGVTPDTCRVWGTVKVRSVEWVEEHYPERCEEVRPEDPYTLMRYHPLLGEWAYLGNYNRNLDSNIYSHHVRVYDIHADPSYKNPAGRSFVLAGDVVLENGTLMREIDTPEGKLKVKRVNYAAARYKIRHGEFWGYSLVEDCISPQNRLNGMDAQIIDALELMGSPNILVPESMELSGPEWNVDYGGGKFLRYQLDPLNPTVQPRIFPEQIPNIGPMYQQRSLAIQDIRDLAGPQAIEVGADVKNVSTTTGLVFMGEQADRRREPREEEIVAAYEKTWKHQLDLLWVLRAEPDEYWAEREDGWAKEQFDRMAIRGQTQIRVEKQSYVDKSLYQREAVREAMQEGLYRLDSQLAIKKVLDYRGLPSDINTELNRQVELAERTWADFLDKNLVPQVDTTLDDFRIRFQTIATLMLENDGIERTNQAQWPQLIPVLAGWEEELLRLETVDAKTVAFYGGRIDEQKADEAYVLAMKSYDEQMTAWEAQSKSAEMAMGDGMPVDPASMGLPPQPPPMPVFLPVSKQERVFLVFQMLLKRKGVAQYDQEFLQFRAYIEALQLYAKEKEMGPMPGMPAPGTPEGNPGAGGATPGLQPSQSMPTPPMPVPGPPSVKNVALTGHPAADQAPAGR